jgi:uncharacterized protein YrrD
MKRKIKSLMGFTIGATDGIVGEVTEFYFDDKTWTIRYVIVETGNWFNGKKILLSTQALLTPDWKNKIFPVKLTMAQIESSPEIDTDKPVSKQQEIELYSHYTWGGSYWASGMGMSGMGMSYPVSMKQAVHNETDADKPDEDHHLRSTHAVTGYNIKAIDGEIGEVEDFILNDNTWSIDFIEVDTGNWFPGKKVLISPKWIKEIDWETSNVRVILTEEQVKNSPEYSHSLELNEGYENSLFNYYSRFVNYK